MKTRFRVRIAPLLAVAALVTLFGCSGTVELEPESRKSLQTVSVSKDIEATAILSGHLDEVRAESRSAMYASNILTAPIAIVMEIVDWGEADKRTSHRFERFLDDAGVDVRSLVRNKFLRRLSSSREFDSVYAQPGDATFRLAIEHGLSDGFGLRGSWKPWIKVVGVLENRAGDLLWKYEALISDHDERIPEIEYPTRQQAFLRRAYTIAADLVAEELVDHLLAG